MNMMSGWEGFYDHVTSGWEEFYDHVTSGWGGNDHVMSTCRWKNGSGSNGQAV